MSFPITNQNPVNSSNTTASSTEESVTVSAPHSRKRKERDEAASLAIRTNVLRPSSPSSNPLPSTSSSHSSSTFAATPQFNTEAGLNLGTEQSSTNAPPMPVGYVPVMSPPIFQVVYGIPLPGGMLFTCYPGPIAIVPALPNPASPEFSLYAPITVFPQPMVFPYPVFSFPPPMISTSGISEAPRVLPPANLENPQIHRNRDVLDNHVPPVLATSRMSEASGLERQIGQQLPPPANLENPQMRRNRNVLGSHVSPVLATSGLSEASGLERQIGQQVPPPANLENPQMRRNRNVLGSHVSTVLATSGLSEASGLERQTGQQVPPPANLENPQMRRNRNVLGSHVSPVLATSGLSEASGLERQTGQQVPLPANLENPQKRRNRNVLSSHVSRVLATFGLSEASGLERQTGQQVPLPANLENPQMRKNRNVLGSHVPPVLATSGMSEPSALERQTDQPVAIPTKSEKSEQHDTFSDPITGNDVKRFFQTQGISYSADVFVDPVYQDKIRKIWSEYPRLVSSKRTKDGKACWEYLDRIKESGDDFSLQFLEIRKISIKLQNGETKEDYGVFAREAIEKNAIIGIYAGKLKLLNEINDKDYTFSLADEGFGEYGVDAKEMGNLTRFINHSIRKHENICSMVFYDRTTPRIVFASKKRIEKGEQLLIDYGKGYWQLKGITPVILTPS